jgi:hypothetical protein
MSKIALSPPASGTATFSITTPSGTSTDRTLNLPDNSGTVLTTATPGVPVNGPAFSAFRSGTQAITAIVWTKVACQTEEFDTNSSYDNATNYRFQPTVAGYYQVSGAVEPALAQTYQYLSFYKNGVDFKRTSVPATNATSVSLSALIYLNGSTDYVEMYVNFSSSINLNGFAGVTFFQAAMVRSAT